ncbi:MAG TPA: hypothetical protein VMW66_05950 [Elusimicrobiales bacterium]|nr:hypothetical protein [Elusimicrobiales bacterium]
MQLRNAESICINRNAEKKTIQIEITAELDCRKSTLHINEKRLADDVEKFWDSIKRKCSKLLSIITCFDQIDYYDNEVDVYSTPIVRLERGKRKAIIGEQTWGAIPKDWEQTIRGTFGESKVIGQYLKFIEEIVGYSTYQTFKAKGLEKELRKVLQGKQSGCSVYNQRYDD